MTYEASLPLPPAEQQIAELGLDRYVAKAVSEKGWRYRLNADASRDYGAATGGYSFWQLDYYDTSDTLQGSSMIAAIPPGGQTELAYWTKAAPRQLLTVHRGEVEYVRAVSCGEAARIEPLATGSTAVLAPGTFYTLRVSPEAAEPGVVSGFYPAGFEWSAAEVDIAANEKYLRLPNGTQAQVHGVFRQLAHLVG